MPVTTDQLLELPLFEGLNTAELEQVAAHLTPVTFVAGADIIKEGDSADSPMFVLLSGQVEVVKRGLDDRSHVITTLSAPSVFGEIELLARRAAIATVTAVTNVEAATLERDTFDEMCRGHESSVLKMIRNLAHTLSYRLAATDERLAAHFDFAVPGTVEKLGQMRNIMYSTWRQKDG